MCLIWWVYYGWATAEYRGKESVRIASLALSIGFFIILTVIDYYLYRRLVQIMMNAASKASLLN